MDGFNPVSARRGPALADGEQGSRLRQEHKEIHPQSLPGRAGRAHLVVPSAPRSLGFSLTRALGKEEDHPTFAGLHKRRAVGGRPPPLTRKPGTFSPDA